MTHTAKDFANTHEVRWCPGCGDHAILKHFQSALAKAGIPPHKTAVISGIGCAARLPYYMNTYGFHTIHGRALPIASGLKLARPDMNVWVITGDGDALSIGGNHYLHFFRRNIDVNVLLFNNHVYGLTKGQYSPTSSVGQISKSTPAGNIEEPLNALHLALTVGAGFIARTFDRDAAYIQSYMMAAQQHSGSALVEILQNCPIFNDGVFDEVIEKKNQAEKTIRLENGKPILFGVNQEKTLMIENTVPKIVYVAEVDAKDMWIHDETSLSKAQILAQLGVGTYAHYPLPLGIIFQKSTELYPKSYQSYDMTLDKALNSGKIQEM